MNKKEIEAYMKSDQFNQQADNDQELLLKYGYTIWKLQSYVGPKMTKDEEGNWVDVEPASAVEVNDIMNRSGLGLQ
jgi:hypothetical protein